MKQLSHLVDALAPVGGATVHGPIEGVSVTALTHRSDDVMPGSMFCCVPGASRDGHDFALEAEAAGAGSLLVERVVEGVKIPQIQVESVRTAVGVLADAFFGLPSRAIPVYGITGTNGKTTTTHLIHAMLESKGGHAGLIGTIGARIGGSDAAPEYIDLGKTTPDSILVHQLLSDMVAAGDMGACMEVSSHALDQSRVSGVRFAAVGFSNLTRDHLDYHKSFEAYYMAKRRLFTEPGPEGQYWPAAINCDDEWGQRLFDELVHVDRGEAPVWGFTLQGMNRASVSAKYQLTPTGANISIESPVGDLVLKSKLRGRFNVENVLCAATMALLGGLGQDEIQGGLDRLEGVRGRFESVTSGEKFGVFVDYAHTPDSLEQVLASARAICDGKVIVVFGCGGDRDRTKRPMMGRAAALGSKLAIVTSDNPRSEDPEAIIAEIRKGMRGGAEVVVEPDRRAAIFAAIEAAEDGDVVIIAGKGHEQGQSFADETVPFDDAEVAREALGAAVTS